MDNEIRKYCEQCKFYSVLGCQSTLICTNGNKFWAADVQPIDRWINVNDRLPKEQETVIVYEKDYGVMWGDYQGIKYSQPVWIVRKSGLIIRTTEVTHWRHLPKPPKQ